MRSAASRRLAPLRSLSPVFGRRRESDASPDRLHGHRKAEVMDETDERVLPTELAESSWTRVMSRVR